MKIVASRFHDEVGDSLTDVVGWDPARDDLELIDDLSRCAESDETGVALRSCARQWHAIYVQVSRRVCPAIDVHNTELPRPNSGNQSSKAQRIFGNHLKQVAMQCMSNWPPR